MKIQKFCRRHLWKPPWAPFVTEQERVRRSERRGESKDSDATSKFGNILWFMVFTPEKVI